MRPPAQTLRLLPLLAHAHSHASLLPRPGRHRGSDESREQTSAHHLETCLDGQCWCTSRFWAPSPRFPYHMTRCEMVQPATERHVAPREGAAGSATAEAPNWLMAPPPFAHTAHPPASPASPTRASPRADALALRGVDVPSRGTQSGMQSGMQSGIACNQADVPSRGTDVPQRMPQVSWGSSCIPRRKVDLRTCGAGGERVAAMAAAWGVSMSEAAWEAAAEARREATRKVAQPPRAHVTSPPDAKRYLRKRDAGQDAMTSPMEAASAAEVVSQTRQAEVAAESEAPPDGEVDGEVDAGVRTNDGAAEGGGAGGDGGEDNAEAGADASDGAGGEADCPTKAQALNAALQSMLGTDGEGEGPGSALPPSAEDHVVAAFAARDLDGRSVPSFVQSLSWMPAPPWLHNSMPDPVPGAVHGYLPVSLELSMADPLPLSHPCPDTTADPSRSARCTRSSPMWMASSE